jgi:drug/metabolite transporter (DMT)-like permease
MFSTAIVITRHHPDVRMMPAVCLGTAMACVAAFFLSGGLAVSLPDLSWLILFGAVNLGMGLAMFAAGARLVPAALAALVSTLDELDLLLDQLDRSVAFPAAAGGPRGRQGSAAAVALPQGWLDDPDDPTVPVGADVMNSGG